DHPDALHLVAGKEDPRAAPLEDHAEPEGVEDVGAVAEGGAGFHQPPRRVELSVAREDGDRERPLALHRSLRPARLALSPGHGVGASISDPGCGWGGSRSWCPPSTRRVACLRPSPPSPPTPAPISRRPRWWWWTTARAMAPPR